MDNEYPNLRVCELENTNLAEFGYDGASEALEASGPEERNLAQRIQASSGVGASNKLRLQEGEICQCWMKSKTTV